MDLQQHLLRQMAFSHPTYGPGQRTEGVTDHIKKELTEVLESNGSPEEWVDVVILALDGLTRSLAYPLESPHRVDPEYVSKVACKLIRDKQSKNEARDWPDWRTADRTKAIEHVENHSDEAKLLREVYEAGKRLRNTAPVDDDFPEMMHNFDSALRAFQIHAEVTNSEEVLHE